MKLIPSVIFALALARSSVLLVCAQSTPPAAPAATAAASTNVAEDDGKRYVALEAELRAKDSEVLKALEKANAIHEQAVIRAELAQIELEEVILAKALKTDPSLEAYIAQKQKEILARQNTLALRKGAGHRLSP